MRHFLDRSPGIMSSAGLHRAVTILAIGLAVVGFALGGMRWSRSLPQNMVDASATGDVAVTFRGTDRSILISAADTLARELKSFPKNFSAASRRLDSTSLRAKGLFQWDFQELEGYARRWEVIATLVNDPKRPMTLASHVDLASEIMEETSSGSLDESRKQIFLSTVSMLDSLEGYLEPGGVYRSTWTDPVFEHSMAKIDRMLGGFPTDDPTAVVLHVVPVPLLAETGTPHQSIRILRDVARRVRLVYPSVEVVITGSMVRQSDQQRGLEQGLAFTTLVGLVGTSLLAWVALGYRLGMSLIGTILLLAGWLIGIMTIRNGLFDLAVARQTSLALPIAVVAPLRFMLGFRHRSNGDGSSLRNHLGSVLIGALTGAAGLGLVALVLDAMISSARSSMAEAVSIALFCSMVATIGLGWRLRSESMPADSPLKAGKSPILRGRFAGLRRSLGTTLVVFGGIGIGRWFGSLSGEGEWIISTPWSSLPAGVVARAEANSAEEARRLAGAFREMPTVGKVVELASWLPQDQAEKLPVIKSLSSIATQWKERPANLTKPEANRFRQSLRLFDGSQDAASPADQVLVDRTVRIARRIEGRLTQLSASDQDRRLASFERLWVDDLNRQFERLGQVARTDPVSAGDLPAPLSAMLHPADGRWIVMIHPKDDSSVTLERFRQEVLEVDPSAGGSAITSAGTIADQLRQILWGFGLALVSAVVVGMLMTRSLRLVVVADLPVVAAMLVTAGVLGWLGMDLSNSTASAWNVAWPVVLAASLSAGWCAISQETGSRRGTILVSTVLMPWSLPMIFSPEGELARIGVTLSLAFAVIPLVTLTLVPGWRAIVLPVDETTFEPSASNAGPDLASTVFFRDAA